MSIDGGRSARDPSARSNGFRLTVYGSRLTIPVPYYRSVPWDRELHVLEEAIRRLGAEYDAFLYGNASRPPVESRKRVEQMIRELTASPSDAAADHYRFATLQGRYNSLRERWERLQEEKEAGRRPGLYGHFSSSGRDAAPPHAPVSLNAPSPGSVKPPREDRSAERALFDRYITAKKEHGENVGAYRYEQFVETLEREREKLRSRLGDGEIVFDVAQREGRVRLVARRRSAGGKKR